MNSLRSDDLSHVVRIIPKDIRSLLHEKQGRLFVAGGFIRSKIAGVMPNDIDLFGESTELLEVCAGNLTVNHRGSKIHKTTNALTILSTGRITPQFITRWTYADAEKLLESFDFTICQAVIWVEDGTFRSLCSHAFYADLAARRLVYTNPVREEAAGGSMMRVLKFLRRGYNIQAPSLAGVMTRVFDAVDQDRLERTHLSTAQVMTGLLREVDPALQVDGLDVTDDQETPIEGLLDVA